MGNCVLNNFGPMSHRCWLPSLSFLYYFTSVDI